jgi:hypothetical protein
VRAKALLSFSGSILMTLKQGKRNFNEPASIGALILSSELRGLVVAILESI